MKCALFPRFAFNVALLIALVPAPRAASATILVPAAGAQEPAAHKAAAIRDVARARVSHVVDVAAPPLDLRAGAPPGAGRRYGWPIAPDAAIPPSQAWLWALLAGALIGLALLANSRFACSVLGHRRSKQGLRFESREHQWVSTCTRCKVELWAEEEAALARRQLGAAAGEWMRNGPRPEPR